MARRRRLIAATKGTSLTRLGVRTWHLNDAALMARDDDVQEERFEK